MFNFFSKKNPNATIVTLKIVGMHCTSCAMSIDGALEDTEGVVEATTSYAKGLTTVTFDPHKTTVDQLQSIVRDAGYETKLI
ncbi:MAG TPA: heavy-metal-associated domain-containing protein [Patescibacteria group bacterium]